MHLEELNLKIVLILTVGFSLAGLLGYFTQRMKLSPILGYLIAGYLIGPFFPGFSVDVQLAEQLAEVGVMLMMFGVGLHFQWQELFNVKRIAIPGAVGQTLITTVVAVFFVHFLKGSWQTGVLIGLAIGVASTVVMMRVLSDNNLLHTIQGHIAVGWLIVEDILTVAVLILLPTIVALLTGESISVIEILEAVVLVIIKFLVLAALMFTLGKRCVSYVLFQVARTRSPELFTLAVLSLTFLIATGSTLLFGTSIALGAFIAGMVIGQTEVRHQAFAYASPMKDAFVVIFFLAVGMLFNPLAIADHFFFFLGILFIILVIKPLAALLIAWAMRCPYYVSLSIAFALAQIGEFSFILAEQANSYHIFPDEAFDIIVACAIISIAINPVLFRWLKSFKPIPPISDSPDLYYHQLAPSPDLPKALIIGFGSIEQDIYPVLERLGYQPVVIEKDVDTVLKLVQEKREAVYGEASFPNMLKIAQVKSVKLLIITILDLTETLSIIHYARDIYPDIPIIARALTIEEKEILINLGIQAICEDEEIASALARKIEAQTQT